MRMKKEQRRGKEELVKGRSGMAEEEVGSVWEEGCAALGGLEASLEEGGVGRSRPVKVLREKAHSQHLSHAMET